MVAMTGGTKFKAALKNIVDKVGNDKCVEIGFFPDKTYPDGTLVSMVAVTQEFGNDKIPARPFFRNMIAKESPSWPTKIAATFKANGYDVERALGNIGDAVVHQLKQSILNTNSPPLAPATIARKGFDKPLIDTSVMINSIERNVKDGTE